MRTQTYSLSFTGSLLILCAGFVAFPAVAFAQKADKATEVYRDVSQIPIPLQSRYLALGDRLQKPGKERISINGVLSDSSGSNAATLVIEKGGKARIDVPAKNSKSIRFDGKSVSKNVGTEDQELLEALVDDLPEVFIEETASGIGFRLVGRRFEGEKGELCDVYEAQMPAKSNPKHLRPIKRYCFDSNTMLLSWVQYPESNAANASIIETRFNDWIIVNGQMFPSTISRRKQGKVVFTLRAEMVTVAPAEADNLFTP